MDQFYDEIHCILGQIRQHNMVLDENFVIVCIIDKLPHSWKDMQHSLKHKKEELTLEQLSTDFRIEKGIRLLNDNVKECGVKSILVPDSTINLMEEGQSSGTRYNKKRQGKYIRSFKFNKKQKGNKFITCWLCGGPHIKKDCKIWKKRRA